MEKNVTDSLLRTLEYAGANSTFYRPVQQFLTQPFSLTAFQQLPFTTKDDLSEHNADFLAVTKDKIADYSTTSGTSGEAVTIYLTKNDLSRLAKNEAHALGLTGVTKADLFQLTTTIDRQFMAGLAYYLGVQEIGAGMIRIGPGVPELQWSSILKNKPTVLIAVPSFVLTLLDYATKNEIDLTATSVQKIICVGESIHEDDLSYNILGRRILEKWNVKLYSTYASTEMGAAFTECEAQNGCHLNEDLLFLEVLDDNGEAISDGSIGEIVVTTLLVEGTPLIRYKTGDLARLYTAPCQCGRTSPRLGPIVGRKNQLIKFKGTTIFPKAIFEILDAIPQISCYKIEVSKDYLGNDALTVLLEKQVETSGLMSQIVEHCKSKLRVVPHFIFLENEYLRNQVFKKNSRKPEKIIFKN
ncbi:MAG: AMP-binding protein [Crocinitomicaceae bacterium]|nr:AMP-binding protein [Crocinitomicaceae bacterium]